MKILYVIDNLEFGGGERGFLQIIKGLDKEKHSIHVASKPSGEFGRKLVEMGIHLEPLNMEIRFNPFNIIKLVRIIKKECVHIVHSQGARADFFARVAVKATRRSHLVSTIQMLVEGYDVNPLKKSIYVALDRFSENFVDKFIVVSKPLEQALIQKHKIRPDKVVLIYNGIEVNGYKPPLKKLEIKSSGVKEEFGLVGDVPVIGAIGRLVWQKGFEYFIRSIPAIIHDIPKSRFMLVGEGPLRQDLESLAISLGISDRLVFTGYRSDIRDILSALDVVVIPSLLEGFPMITLEAMAMEKPIVTTAIGGIMEQITNGKEGLLIEPENPHSLAQAVKRLVDDLYYARSLGINARAKVVQDFSVHKMITETIKVYETVCRRQPSEMKK